MTVRSPAPNRQQLAVVFKDPETRIAMEALFRQVALALSLFGPPAVFPGGIEVVGNVETDTLEINATPAVAIAPNLFTIPITTSAGTFYLLVSDTP